MVKCLQQRVLIVINCCILFCYGIQDERECHYWYRKFPATPSVCHETSQTTTVTLVCEVQYRPLNSSDSIEVRWYRSRDEENAGREGEILNDVNKYQQSNGDPTPVNQTFMRQYLLGILQFSSSDRGYYWCQMVVNNVSLSPSPYGHIYGPQCFLRATTCIIDQFICAQNTHAQYMAYNMLTNISYNCILLEFHAVVTSRTASRNTLVCDTSQSTNKRTLATMSPTVSREGVNCDSTHSHVCAAGVASGLVVLILSSLMVMVLCFFFLRNQGNVNLDTKDAQYDNIEIEETQNEEILEPYYSEITYNDNSDFGYMMKPNISYSTSQITSTTINISGNGQSLARVCTSCKSSVEASGKIAKQNQSSDYEDIH